MPLLLRLERVAQEWRIASVVGCVGDLVFLHPKAPPVPVLIVEPYRAIVLGGPVDPSEGPASLTTGTWGFFLKEIDEQTTRLIMRIRGRRTPGLLSWVYSYGLLEPAHFIMERKMMLGIKARAEGATCQTAAAVETGPPVGAISSR
jgi:hypothetical protein